MSDTIRIPVKEMHDVFCNILQRHHFIQDKAAQCAEVFVSNSADGVYTHGVNRFPRFVQYIKDGFVKGDKEPTLKNGFGGIEQWDGNLGPGPLNAIGATNRVLELAQQYGIGCVGLANTNHWMRGGYYGWLAAKKGFVFIGWTNTIANLPAWNAVDARLGNNPLVIALPYKEEAIVLDMAMSQFSFGTMELAVMKGEQLPVWGGYDNKGELTTNPSPIMESQRPLPIGYWKGSGLALLLDILSTILSAGLSTHEVSRSNTEYSVSQVFVAIDLNKLGSGSSIGAAVERIIRDYHQSVAIEGKRIRYPGERVLETRNDHLLNGIPVLKKVWEEIVQL